MLLIGAAFRFLLIPTLGAFSDKVGRRPLYLTGAVGVAVWSYFFSELFDTSVRYTGASVITVAAVLFAKETRGTSMRHDRVVRGSHEHTDNPTCSESRRA
jgi:MFS family permease